MANKYEVLTGKHREPNGPRKFITYNKGDCVISDTRLDLIFPCKFKDHGIVIPPKPKKAPKAPKAPEPAAKVETAPEPAAAPPETGAPTETETEPVAAGKDKDGWESEKD